MPGGNRNSMPGALQLDQHHEGVVVPEERSGQVDLDDVVDGAGTAARRGSRHAVAARGGRSRPRPTAPIRPDSAARPRSRADRASAPTASSRRPSTRRTRTAAAPIGQRRCPGDRGDRDERPDRPHPVVVLRHEPEHRRRDRAAATSPPATSGEARCADGHRRSATGADAGDEHRAAHRGPARHRNDGAAPARCRRAGCRNMPDRARQPERRHERTAGEDLHAHLETRPRRTGPPSPGRARCRDCRSPTAGRRAAGSTTRTARPPRRQPSADAAATAPTTSRRPTRRRPRR